MRLTMKSTLGFALTVGLLLVLSIPVIGAYKSHNNDQDSNAFLAAYPEAKGTKLDNCYLCHTGGKVSGKTKDSCDYCHSVFGFKTPHGSITDTLNQFGKDYLANGKNQAAFTVMAQIDSDGDSYSNDAEIRAGLLPGDAKDNPAAAEAPHKLYNRADLRNLNSVKQFMALDTNKSGDYYTEYKGVDIWTLLQDAGVADDAATITVYAIDGFSKNFNISDLKLVYEQGKFFTKYPWISYPLNSGYVEGQTLPGELHYLLAYENDGRPLVDGKINMDTGKLDGEGPYRFVTPLSKPVTPDRSAWSIDRADPPFPYNYNRPTIRNADYCIKSVVAIQVNTATNNSYSYDYYGKAWEMIEKGQLVVYGALKQTTIPVTNENNEVPINTAKPVVTLVGNAEVTIPLNGSYNEAGVTAKDGNGVDISSRIVIINTVNPKMAGDYTVTYNVTDSVGNVAYQVVRTVHVTGVGRLSGWDSVDTALEIAKASYTGKVTNVILATSENYPDALVGSVLAYKLKAPILLVGRSDADQEKILAYLKEHMNATGTVYISGGTAAVSSAMEAKVTASGFENITRLGGNDRYETAIKIAEYLGVKQGTPIVLAYGENYPDALSVSCAAAVMQSPILLVQKDGMSDAVKKKIAEIKPSKVYIVGPQGVISAEVESQVAQITSLDKANIVRIGGVDRFETSLEVAKYLNLAGHNVCLATGNNFPDALAGSVSAALSNAPIILVDVNLSANTKAYLKSRKITGATIFGGEGVLNKEVEQELSNVIEQNSQNFVH